MAEQIPVKISPLRFGPLRSLVAGQCQAEGTATPDREGTILMQNPFET